MAMNLSEFQKSLSAPCPAYLLVSDQDYLKKKVFEWCREQVPESARSFDWSVFDLESDSTVDVVNQARTIPWLSAFRWIFVRNAEKADSLLTTYLKQPNPRSVLILESRRKVKEWGTLPAIESGDNLKPIPWLIKKARSQGFELDGQAAKLLVDRVGNDLQTLDMELEKLILSQWEDRTIGRTSVEQMIADVKEQDIFEMIGAIASRNESQALQSLTRIFESGTSPQQILSLLYWNFSRLLVAREMLAQGKSFPHVLRSLKIWSYRGRELEMRRYPIALLEQILLRLREADRLFKSTRTSERFHLERVVIDTCRSGLV